MAQKKLKRFNEIKSFANVLEKPEGMQGEWNKFFNNQASITLELACGKGEYTVGLAELYKNRNLIGIDIKGNRMWAGAKKALRMGLSNVAFLRTHIDKINNYFNKDEVSEIWITFPDPQLRKSRAKKRLTHPLYLRLYKEILKKDGVIHLKTDSPELYNFTKEVIDHFELLLIDDRKDLYADEVSPELQIKTHYESLNIAGSNTVFYLQFTLSDKLIEEESYQSFILKYKTEVIG